MPLIRDFDAGTRIVCAVSIELPHDGSFARAQGATLTVLRSQTPTGLPLTSEGRQSLL